MISYCNVALPNQTSELQAYLDNYLDLNGVTDGEVGVWPPPGLDSIPVPAQPQPFRPRLGVLSWPGGTRAASNWATAYFLCSSDKLTEIRTAVGDPATFQDLVLSDGVNDPVTASMMMLPPRPLFQCGGEDNELYLLTLVDARHPWTLRPAEIDEPASWTELYSQLATTLDCTLTPDTISASYLTPTERWNGLSTRYTPAILDAVAATVGQRVVVGLDGTVTTENYNTALASVEEQYDLYRKIAGGFFASEDLRRVVPESVTVCFRDVSSGVEAAEPYTYTDDLASLSLPAFGDSVGIAGTSATVFADLDYDGTNAAECAALGFEAILSWYNYRLADLDVQFAGLVPWVPTGCDYLIEWTHTDTLLGTRIQREPFNWQQTGDWNWEGGSESVGTLVEVTGYNSTTRYHTVKRKTWSGSPGDVVDYSPLTTYTTCRTSSRTIAFAFNYQIPTGTLCYLTPISDVPGDYWIEPTGNYATDTTPGTVSTYSQTFKGNKVVDGTFGVTLYATIDPFLNGISPGLAGLKIGSGHLQPWDGVESYLGISSRGSIVSHNLTATYGSQGAAVITLSGTWQSDFGGNILGIPGVGPSVGAVIWQGAGVGPLTGGGGGSFLTSVGNRMLYGTTVPTAGYPGAGPSTLVCAYGQLTNAGTQAGVGGFSIQNPYQTPSASSGKDGLWTIWQGGVYWGGILVGTGWSSGPTTGVVTLQAGQKVYADDPGSRTTLYLPGTATEGDSFEIVGIGAGGWDVSQRAGMTIRSGSSATTTGTGGHLRGDQWTAATIECVADGTDFVVTASGGTLTWV